MKQPEIILLPYHILLYVDKKPVSVSLDLEQFSKNIPALQVD